MEITPLLAVIDMTGLSFFLMVGLFVAVAMLIWDTVEVGRNDAANLVNAAYGARILTRRNAVWIAGIGVVIGACLSSGVVDTARKGIFDPAMLDDAIQTAIAIYIAVYIVDTVLLYSYSAFGMPVSTTACLVFELLGASFAVGGSEIVKWPNAGKVVMAIVLSIVVSGVAGFFIQRAVRGSIRDRGDHLVTLLLHGAWIGGGMLSMLTYFMVMKGMKNVPIVKWFNAEVVQSYGTMTVVLLLWAGYALIIHFTLITFRRAAARRLFPYLAIVGTFCMGIAFGQNDLANCASPGLSVINLIEHRDQGVALASKVSIPSWMLFASGLLLLSGMLTKRAHRVTEAAVSAGSMSNSVALWAPNWCLRVARRILAWKHGSTEVVPSLAPSPIVPDTEKVRDYDAVRACVILGVSASVIAMASSFKLPVSTTYVTFAAVVATGAADRILQRGDADLKLARTIWVVFSWFSAAVIAAVAAGIVCKIIDLTGVVGIAIGLGLNLVVRKVLSGRGDAQVKRAEEAARERANPEEFVDEEG
ncbi:MAG: inorganic phosphate transporter [Planctomycetota bacterium]